MKHKATAIFVPALIALLLAVSAFDPLPSARNRLDDLLYQRLSTVSPDIIVIGIDEETLAEMGPFQRWSREGMAELIEKLTENPDAMPAVIGVDVGFYGELSETADARLASAAERAGNVVVASLFTFGNMLVEDADGFHLAGGIVAFEEPYAALGAVARSGHVNFYPDEDGVVRRSLFSIVYNNRTVESFAHAVYRTYTGGETAPPLSQSGEWYIPYAGKPSDYYGTRGAGCSFVRVLEGAYPAEFFADAIVLIGAYADGLMDSHFTPVSRDTPMYGVEVHANAVQAMLEGNYKTVLPHIASLALMLLLMLAVAALSFRLDFRVAGAVTLGVTLACAGLGMLLYALGFVLSVLYPLIGVWVVYLLSCFYSYLVERRERRKMHDMLNRYLSPQVVSSLTAKGASALRLGGERRDVAVLFVDIRGFTTLSESLPPEDVVEFLNRYLDLTTRSIFGNDGTVDKFIGDATMGLFNAPIDLPDYTFRAVKAGLDMVEGARLLGDSLTLADGRKVGFGVGIHCGDAVVGNIGSLYRMDYTAIGDTVNTAARLEGQAQAGEVIISQAVYDRVKDRIEAERLGERQLKGKAAGFVVYRVNGLRASGEGME